MCCSVLQCVTVCCGVLQCKCVAVWCSVLQCVSVCCSVLQCVAVCREGPRGSCGMSHVTRMNAVNRSVYLRMAVYSSVLQLCGSVLQCVMNGSKNVGMDE